MKSEIPKPVFIGVLAIILIVIVAIGFKAIVPSKPIERTEEYMNAHPRPAPSAPPQM